MKTNVIVFLTVGVLIFGSVGLAQEGDALVLGEPAFITPAGQSADGLILQMICRTNGIRVVYNNLFDADSLQAMMDGKIEMPVSARSAGTIKTLILVPGGSTKGLGAAKIDEERERARVDELIEFARIKGMPIVVCHMGGAPRRGSLSDLFNQQAAEAADVILVVEGGNDDGFFTGIAQQKGIPIHIVDAMTDIGVKLAKLFGKE
jgi:hypothetical protein